MRIEIENWWKQALADLKSSKNCISSGDFFLSVFISQQAVPAEMYDEEIAKKHYKTVEKVLN